MMCCLCLADSSFEEYIEIFHPMGIELDIASVLKEHFWFEPKIDDISTKICNPCWITVSSFHDYYVRVKQAHRLAEKIPIKNEEKKETTEYRPLEMVTWENDGELNTREQFEFETESDEAVFAPDESCDEIYETQSISIGRVRRSSRVKTAIKSPAREMARKQTNNEKVSTEQTIDQNPLIIKNKRGRPRSNLSALSAKEVTTKCSEEYGENKQHQSKEYEIENDEAVFASDESHVRRSSRVKTTVKSPTKEIERKQTSNKNVSTEQTIDQNSLIIRNKRGRPRGNLSALSTKEVAEEYDNNKQHQSIEDLDEKILKYMKYISCDICSAEFITFAKMKKHMTLEHKCKGYSKCCSIKFYKRTLLADHIERHLNPAFWKCEECDKVLANKQCLRNHKLIMHQPDTVKTFLCSKCPKKFAKAYLLEKHRALHDSRSQICKFCTKSFANLNTLKTHIKIIHENYGTMCDICAKFIVGKKSFLRHQLEHSGIELPKVQCEKCGSWYKDKHSLQKHKQRHSEEGIIHECNICGKIAPNRGALLNHKRYVHAAQRVFECNICFKSFKQSIALREHMATHTGEALYRCPHCSKTFNSKANMHSHRKKVHPIEFEETRQNKREKKFTQHATKNEDKARFNPEIISVNGSREFHSSLITIGNLNESVADGGTVEI